MMSIVNNMQWDYDKRGREYFSAKYWNNDHPTSERVEKVIERLEYLFRDDSNTIIDMRKEYSIPCFGGLDDYTGNVPCDTPGCLAGAYHVACGFIGDRKNHPAVDDVKENVERHYSLGAAELARDLGFDGVYNAEEEKTHDIGVMSALDPDCMAFMAWAKLNPDLWGNDNGLLIFACVTAFGDHFGGEGNTEQIALEDVIGHFKKVARLLKRREAKR